MEYIGHMKRKAYEQLLKWKMNPARKPLLIRGARQVGKTWLLKEFGQQEYSELHYFNFEEDATLSSLFARRLTPGEVIRKLSLYSGKSLTPESGLIVFDEVQLCDRALNSLKYFAEEAPEYHLIAAGSLLGIRLADSTSFPVGKVQFIDLCPFSFMEFLRATGDARYADLLDEHPLNEALPEPFHNHLTDQLRFYYYTGGMPEAVAAFAANETPATIREIQRAILDGYELDFIKHSGKLDAAKISLIWQSVPRHLANENHKFVFSALRQGARARNYEESLKWLESAGLILRCSCVHHPKSPLMARTSPSIFKIYACDVGLLGAMAGIEPRMMVQGDALFTAYTGSLVENFVAQHLSAHKPLAYWKRENNLAEIDFLLERDGIIPVEIKAGINPKSKSMRSYQSSYTPSSAYRLSLLNFRKEETLTNLPLYAVHRLLPEQKA
jgi:predicted AAA+ superfamily ATPase